MTTEGDAAERAIKEVEEATTGENRSPGVNPRLQKSDQAPLDDRSAHTRTTADAADETAWEGPDARTDIGGSDDTYKRTRGVRTR